MNGHTHFHIIISALVLMLTCPSAMSLDQVTTPAPASDLELELLSQGPGATFLEKKEVDSQLAPEIKDTIRDSEIGIQLITATLCDTPAQSGGSVRQYCSTLAIAEFSIAERARKSNSDKVPIFTRICEVTFDNKNAIEKCKELKLTSKALGTVLIAGSIKFNTVVGKINEKIISEKDIGKLMRVHFGNWIHPKLIKKTATQTSRLARAKMVRGSGLAGIILGGAIAIFDVFDLGGDSQEDNSSGRDLEAVSRPVKIEFLDGAKTVTILLP